MSDSAPFDPVVALQERVSKLEKSLEDSARKAAIVAVIAAVLGSGGVAGVLQIWTVAPPETSRSQAQRARGEEQRNGGTAEARTYEGRKCHEGNRAPIDGNTAPVGGDRRKDEGLQFANAAA